MSKKGEWISVCPTDCFPMLPIHECSICGYHCSGYEPDVICPHCGASNNINLTRRIVKPILGNLV